MFSKLKKSVSSIFVTSNSNEVAPDDPPKNIPPLNGSVFNGTYLPDEILVEILIHVDNPTLLSCRITCKKWESVISNDVFKCKALYYTFKNISNELIQDDHFAWQFWYAISANRVFYKNFIENPCGYDGLNNWFDIIHGGDGWQVESPPVGTKPLPEDPNFDKYTTSLQKKPSKSKKNKLPPPSCFATSHGRCVKTAAVHLESQFKGGCVSHFMDAKIKPTIVYSEWICRRSDCGGRYTLDIELIGENHTIIKSESTKVILIEDHFDWIKIEKKIENYDSGVRCIKLIHSAGDDLWWAGHYGPKITRSSVMLIPHGLTYKIDPIAIKLEDYPNLTVDPREQEEFNMGNIHRHNFLDIERNDDYEDDDDDEEEDIERDDHEDIQRDDHEGDPFGEQGF